MGNLTAKRVETERRPGKYADGGCLYLQVQEGTGKNAGKVAKSWVFRYALDGRVHDMGLGSVKNWTLAEARDRARKQRQLLDDGIDPLVRRKEERAVLRAQAEVPTFREAAEQYITEHRSEWTNAKHAAQWSTSLEQHVYPTIGGLRVDLIDKGDMVRCLQLIWVSTNETARRVRARSESVLSWATAQGYRTGENPARWKGNLEHLLAGKGKKRQKVEAKHHAAIDHRDLPVFMAELKGLEELNARALEFCILTAARTQEVLAASWSEFADGLWIIPASRMKTGEEHRIPLSTEAQELLANLPRFKSGLLFEGGTEGKQASPTALLQTLKRLRPDCTVHGFRAAFRSWGSANAKAPEHVLEQALAHKIPDAVVRAYQGDDLLELRRRLMQSWASFATGQPVDNVVKIA